jgi:hypothetical protein
MNEVWHASSAETRTVKTTYVSHLEFPRRSRGHQDHPPAAGHRRRQDLTPDRLRRPHPDQRPRRRAGPGPPRPRALVRATVIAAIKDTGYLHIPKAHGPYHPCRNPVSTALI